MGTRQYQYYSYGELVGQACAKRQLVGMEYDRLGRMTRRVEAGDRDNGGVLETVQESARVYDTAARIGAYSGDAGHRFRSKAVTIPGHAGRGDAVAGLSMIPGVSVNALWGQPNLIRWSLPDAFASTRP